MDAEYLKTVRSRIFLMNGITMQESLFNEKADKFSELIVNTLGPELLGKYSVFMPMIGEFWMLKYVNVEDGK